MATAKLHTVTGEFKADIELPANVFETDVSKACVYYAITAYRANQRQGTHKSKSRSEVSGSGKKPWKQKGTGRARSGTNTSPIWVRGNKAHGPNPRDYSVKINKKVRRKALLSALTIKAQEGAISVFENLAFETPKTKDLLSRIVKANMEQKNTLFLAAEGDKNLLIAARNIPWARVMRVQDVNTYELIRARKVIFSEEALASITGGSK
jgi:large subunit ribosomal protein L4